MTSRLDTTFLKFRSSDAVNNYITMTASTSALNFSNTNVSRPMLLTSATSVDSCVIDANGNIYITGSYKSGSVIQIYNTSGSPSSYSLPIASITSPYIVKFDKYGFVVSYTVLVSGQELPSGISQKLNMLIDSKGSLYLSGAFSGSAIINNFYSTALTSSFTMVGLDTSMRISASYLVVAGGGASQNSSFGYSVGGGGAGGLLYGATTINSTNITVGQGGIGSISPSNNGENSSIGSLIAYGGGGGNSGGGASGGSGGGTGSFVFSPAPGGGNTIGQGNNGGGSDAGLQAGGGGGSGSVGGNGTGVGGNGGNGTVSNISGSSVTYAAGGGGGGGGIGGSGGGGNGATGSTAATSATGYGSGGGGPNGSFVTATNGSSGIVIIRYTSTVQLAIGGTVTQSGGDFIHTFTSSGKFEVIGSSGFIVKYNESGIATKYTQIDQGFIKAMCIDPFTNLYVTGLFGSNLSTTPVYSISSEPTSSRVNFSLPSFGLGITTAVASYIIKYTNDSPSMWTLIGSNNNSSNCRISDIRSDSYGTIYACGIQNYVSSVYDFVNGDINVPKYTFPYINDSSGIIVKYNSSGLVNSINIISPTSIGSLNTSNAISMAINSTNDLYTIGTYSNTNTVTPVYNFFTSTSLNYNQFPTTVSKLVGTGMSGGFANQGYWISLSGDGSVLISGGRGDSSNIGATWVFVRSGTNYQQFAKLVGSGYTGTPFQGNSVSISNDGNTIAVGGPIDSSTGATWIFIRSGQGYMQLGDKLVGAGNVGNPQQGTSVSLSANGDTLAIGGPQDNGQLGTTWIFIRTGNFGTGYTQLGSKLIASGYSGSTSQQGTAVFLSGDGSTLAVSSQYDAGSLGATWIFTRTGGFGTGYTQFGPIPTYKIVASGYTGTTRQGTSVSLTYDGSILAAGASTINAVFVFARYGNIYSQIPNGTAKFVGTDFSGGTNQGYSTFLSSDGSVLSFGGIFDNTNIGATWIFIRSGNSYVQRGTKIVGSGYTGATVYQGFSTSLSSDGTILATSGPEDNGGTGAVWVFNSFNATNSFSLPVGSTNSFSSRWSSAGNALSQTILNSGGTGSLYSISCSPDDSVYINGNKNIDTTLAVYNFSTGSSVSTFYLPTQTVENYVSKWDKFGTSVSWTGTVGKNSNTVNQSSSSVVVSDSYGSIYLSGSFVQSSSVSDFSTSPTLGTTRYSFSSAVSNNIFLAKYSNNGQANYLNNPSISNVNPPTSSTGLATKSYVDGSFETITISNNQINPSPNVVSVINPAPVNRTSSVQPIISGQINNTPGFSNCLSAIDSTNGFIYVAGQIPGAQAFPTQTQVYNTDGSYSGFYMGTSSNFTYSAFVIKYNTTGVALSWTRFDNISFTGGITVDKSGNLFLACSVNNETAFNVYNFSTVSVFNSSPFQIPTLATGTGLSGFVISWSSSGIASRWTRLGNTVTNTPPINDQFNTVITDSSQNIYAAGQMVTSGIVTVYDFSSAGALGTTRFTIPTTATQQTIGAFDAIIIKWSATGVATSWTRLVSNNLLDQANFLTLDSFDNLYACGVYSGSSSIYDFSTTSGFGASSFTLPYMGTGAPFIIRWNSSGSVSSWNAIGPTSIGASGLSLACDSENNLYASGMYYGSASLNGTMPVLIGTYNMCNFGTTVPVFSLPNGVYQNAFLAKWSYGGNLVGATVLGVGTGSLGSKESTKGLSIATDGDNSVYMSGVYNNTTAIETVYNFFTGNSAGAFSSGWTSPFSLPASVANDTFLIKWNSSGTGTAWTTIPDGSGSDSGSGSGHGAGTGINIDSQNGINLTGGLYLESTTAVYNMSSSGSAGNTRFSYSPQTAGFSQYPLGKLVGTGFSGASAMGSSSSIYNNTLAIGGSSDSSVSGAVWIFVRSGGIWYQEGPKLKGTSSINMNQGISVSLYENTLAFGSTGDGGNVGATWIYLRSSNNTWNTQAKLIGTGFSGASFQGISVSLYRDTVAVGGHQDNVSVGAVWIFTRVGTTWTQQGAKLIGSGYSATAPNFGRSVSLYEDTLAIGSPSDKDNTNTTTGSTFIFVRTSGTWTQQGGTTFKLIGTGFSGGSQQGFSVSLYQDTLVSGGFLDNGLIGASWIFVRSGTTWTQQGQKLVGSGYSGLSNQGYSVSLYNNTLIIGGYGDSISRGAIWLFNRNGITWTQSGDKLIGFGYSGNSRFGYSVNLFGDSVVIGGDSDDSNLGATWVFDRSYNSNYYAKYSANGQVNLGQYLETFYVPISRPVSSSAYKKTIILKTPGYQYRIVEPYTQSLNDNSETSGYKTISVNEINGPKTIQLFWNGNSWSN
jgi:hypothetical protein